MEKIDAIKQLYIASIYFYLNMNGIPEAPLASMRRESITIRINPRFNL